MPFLADLAVALLILSVAGFIGLCTYSLFKDIKK